MTKKILIIGLTILIAIPLFASRVKKPVLTDFAAGRIRFVDGTDATFSFNRKTGTPGIDYLVLLGETFQTHASRLELATLNGNLYWMGRNTGFYFESIDPKGETSKMFLGKGAFVVKTKRPFTMISGAGSIYFPGNGRYLVMKNAEGKDKVFVTTLQGDRPVIVKKSTIFSRIKLVKKENPALMAWVANREANWKKTIVRTNIFSQVDKLPPFVAYTGADGQTHWRRVTDVTPIYRMNGMLVDNWFLYDPTYLNATGIWVPYSIGMDDFEMALYFATNKWNSVRWAWNVENGWHAEWYWDPLAGFGAEYNNPFLMSHNNLAELWLNYDFYREMARDNWRVVHPRQEHPEQVIAVNSNRRNRQIRNPRTNPWIQGLGTRDIVRLARSIPGDTNEWLRRRVDRTLRSQRQARRLDTSDRMIVRAGTIVRSRNRDGRARWREFSRSAHSFRGVPVYFRRLPPVATVMPVPVTTRRTRSSRN